MERIENLRHKWSLGDSAEAKYKVEAYEELIEMLKEVNNENKRSTREVKEVDLDKEIELMEDKYHGFESLSRADIIVVAKHFYELGLMKGE